MTLFPATLCDDFHQMKESCYLVTRQVSHTSWEEHKIIYFSMILHQKHRKRDNNIKINAILLLDIFRRIVLLKYIFLAYFSVYGYEMRKVQNSCSCGVSG